MRRLATLLFGLTLVCSMSMAQDIDNSFIFIDENEEVIENGSTVVRNLVEDYGDGVEVIYSGVSVMNTTGSTDYIKMIYVISQLDNGFYQICFPSTCNSQVMPGQYETQVGQLMADLQDIQSEWFPTADGECVVTLTIETFTKEGMFPPTYIHKAYGPTITLKFVKGGAPEPVKGDVNGDGEVNISDINAVIQAILAVDTSNEAADVNGDGEVNISDINAVIEVILSPASAN